MAVDENGELITGEMESYQPTEMTMCKHPANGRKALVRMSVESATQAAELRAAGVAADAPPEPEPSWLATLDQRLSQALTQALAPLTKFFTTKGRDAAMADATAPAPQTEAEAPRADAVISDADWTKIGTLIDEKIAAAFEAYKAENAATDSSADATATEAAKSADASAEAPAPAPADKSAGDVVALAAAIEKMAADNAQTQAALRSLLNSVPAGNTQPSGPELQETQRGAGTWTSSPLSAALASVPKAV